MSGEAARSAALIIVRKATRKDWSRAAPPLDLPPGKCRQGFSWWHLILTLPQHVILVTPCSTRFRVKVFISVVDSFAGIPSLAAARSRQTHARMRRTEDSFALERREFAACAHSQMPSLYPYFLTSSASGNIQPPKTRSSRRPVPCARRGHRGAARAQTAAEHTAARPCGGAEGRGRTMTSSLPCVMEAEAM